MSDTFKSIIELINTFDTEQKCIDFLESKKWNGKVVSPFDPTSKVYKCSNNLYKCKNTQRLFNVKTGTLFAESKLSLKKWFTAIYMLLTSKKGISSCQLAVQLNITQKSAWIMLQKIRHCLGVENESVLSDKVEVDEVYFGGVQSKAKFGKNVQGRSLSHKVPVLGMIQRGGKVVAKVIKDASIKSIKPNIIKHIKENSIIISDKWSSYNWLDSKYIHKTVCHSKKEFDDTKYIDGFCSLVKRSVMGIYQYISKKHLQIYLDEFVFRYNTNKLSVYEKFNRFFNNITVKMTYKLIITLTKQNKYCITNINKQSI